MGYLCPFKLYINDSFQFFKWDFESAARLKTSIRSGMENKGAPSTSMCVCVGVARQKSESRMGKVSCLLHAEHFRNRNVGICRFAPSVSGIMYYGRFNNAIHFLIDEWEACMVRSCVCVCARNCLQGRASHNTHTRKMSMHGNITRKDRR